MNKKTIISLLATVTLTSLSAVHAEISKKGWIKENNSWYFYQNQKPLKNQWLGEYYLKSDGKMATSEWVYDKNYKAWYYLKGNGAYAQNEWADLYYLKPNGKMAISEWIYDKNYKAWYYLKGNGAYAQNEWADLYYLKPNGKMAISEWIYDKNYKAWYYLKGNGAYAQNEWVDLYYLKPNGKMAISEWIYDKNYKAWYYLKGNGAYAQNEWIDSYYLKPNGKMAISEWIYDNNYKAWYYLKSNGTYAYDEEVDGYYLESNGKRSYLKNRVDNSIQIQRQKEEKKALEQAIRWLESEDSISINEEYAKRLNQYGSTAQGKNQANISALKSISKVLLRKNQKETGVIPNTLLEKYNLRSMPEDMKKSLNLYAASLINSVRNQMKKAPVKVTETMLTIAEKIAKEYINDGRFIADGKGHDANAINKVVKQYGILTSSDNSKVEGSQYYENAVSTDFQNLDYFTIRTELREAILLFLFNGIEYDHAQSIAGVNFGKTYKDNYFGVGLGSSGHFIQVEDSYIEKTGALPFSKQEISQKVRKDYEQKVIKRLKDHLATLK